MRIEPYRPTHYDQLARAARAFDQSNSLSHRPFVDHYFTGQEWCRLYLAQDSEGAVLATQGLEHMPFVIDGRPVQVTFTSNFHSLRPGAGAVLFLKLVESCPLALVLGGTEDTHRILRRRAWSYFTGVRLYVLNRQYEVHDSDPRWRRLAKNMMDRAVRVMLPSFASRVPSDIRARLTVREEADYREDMLPEQSPFPVRFAPPVEYLRWRYGIGLSFVRYRVFTILDRGRQIGFVVLNDHPDRLIVAHSDGEHASLLAYGTVLAVMEASAHDRRPRSAALLSSHPTMQRIFEQLGFRALGQPRQLALGGRGEALPQGPDASGWLVNLDWGDNGLRAPFLDQHVMAGSTRG